jgi:phosphonate transport system permease protein
VVADIVDDSGPEVRTAFIDARLRGAGRLTAALYTVLPGVTRQLLSYGFYRLECGLRSSVVLGAIGAGGLGFEIAISVQGLQYRQLWTLIYTLIVVSLLLEAWSSAMRRRASAWLRRISAAVVVVSVAGSWWWLRLDPRTLFDARARDLGGRLADEAWPPRLPSGGWSTLWSAAIDTVQLSVVAIVVAAAVALPLSFAAARPLVRGGRFWLGATVSWLTRMLCVAIRAVPPTLWAFLVLFVVFPGPLAGGLALGIYTGGVLARLVADTVESLDGSGAASLQAQGATPLTAFAYGTMPVLGPRVVSLASYRWEVAARESVIVGLVGAGGLGRLLGEQNAALDEAAMLTTIVALIVVSMLIDAAGGALRRQLS